MNSEFYAAFFAYFVGLGLGVALYAAVQVWRAARVVLKEPLE